MNYPNLDEDSAFEKICRKKEVYDLVSENTSDEFYQTHQGILRILCSPLTNYDKFLIIHSTGTGKTFGMFGIIEINRYLFTKVLIII